MLDLLQDIQDSPFPWLNVVSSLGKLCQTVLARNKQANLYPTLNKGAGGASLKVFVTDRSWGWDLLNFLTTVLAAWMELYFPMSYRSLSVNIMFSRFFFKLF